MRLTSLLRAVPAPVLRLLASVRDRRLPSEVVLTLDDTSSRFHLDTAVEYDQFRDYATSPDGSVLQDFFTRLCETDACWDIGANVGVYTCFAAQLLPPDRLVAVEPHPKNADRLRANLRLNGQDGRIYQVALTDDSGAARLRLNGRNVDGAFGRLDDDGDVRVDAITGDALHEKRAVPSPTVVKIDVQGAEREVIGGSRRTFARENCRLIYCNVYEKHRPSATDRTTANGDRRSVEDQLVELGFDVDRLADWSGGYFVRGVREEATDETK